MICKDVCEQQILICYILNSAFGNKHAGYSQKYLCFDLIRHKHRQNPRVAIHMVPRYLAAGEEADQGHVAQGAADDL